VGFLPVRPDGALADPTVSVRPAWVNGTTRAQSTIHPVNSRSAIRWRARNMVAAMRAANS